MSVDHYAVMGHPVAHSRSPEIHAWFAKSMDQSMEYDRIDPGLEGFEDAVAKFQQQGGSGLNITLPFKERALALAQSASGRAQLAGAANTLIMTEAGVEADNTDGAGLVQDLTVNLGWTLVDAQVLILGAGGAVRGIVAPLLAAGVGRLVIANRTPDRAVALVEHLGQAGLPSELAELISTCALTDIPIHPYTLVINATSGGHGGEVPPLSPEIFAQGARAYDLSYGVAAKPFLEVARAQGAGSVSDGLGMLVEQAAESFQRWRAMRPDTRELLANMRANDCGN